MNNEELLAEKFSKEIDRLLSGETPTRDPGDVLGTDIDLASRLMSANHSHESRVRNSLKSRLLSRQNQPWTARFFAAPPKKRLALALCSGLAVLILAPMALQKLSDRLQPMTFSMIEGFGARSSTLGNKGIASGGSPYEGGYSGLAPGVSPADHNPPDLNTEGYSHIQENAFLKASDNPLSTFSIDVDVASYANTRRFLGDGRLPPKDAVRIEEFINYFRYDYPEPVGEHPFSITTELAECPWKSQHMLVSIGIKGKSIAKKYLPPNNLVFLIDTSGSMESPDKLPLLQKALRLLVEELRPEDRISIATYAGSAGLILPSTPGSEKTVILDALDQLQAGGWTAGSAGIQLAYKVAADNFLKKGNNRVILATDGDFNVGITSEGELVRLIEEKRRQGVFLTVLGFGRGNYQDAQMEKLADKGNGNYAYIDDIFEAKKVLVSEMGATLFTIAKDVKIQVEFNPARVSAYRLIGYENRMLAMEDFNDDKKDAGELGAGHNVTALYEIIPVGVKTSLPEVDALKYQKTLPADAASTGRELMTVKFRYKKPDGDKSLLIENVLSEQNRRWSDASENLKFAAAAAGFGMLLRGSEFSGDLTYHKVSRMAQEGRGKDEDGYRTEMIQLVEKTKLLISGSLEPR